METSRQLEILEALAGPTRMKMVEILNDKELACENPDQCSIDDRCCDVGELAEQLGITAPSVSHHLKQMRRAGLVTTIRQGRRVYCSLNRSAFEEIANWLGSFAGSASSPCRE